MNGIVSAKLIVTVRVSPLATRSAARAPLLRSAVTRRYNTGRCIPRTKLSPGIEKDAPRLLGKDHARRRIANKDGRGPWIKKEKMEDDGMRRRRRMKRTRRIPVI